MTINLIHTSQLFSTEKNQRCGILLLYMALRSLTVVDIDEAPTRKRKVATVKKVTQKAKKRPNLEATTVDPDLYVSAETTEKVSVKLPT